MHFSPLLLSRSCSPAVLSLLVWLPLGWVIMPDDLALNRGGSAIANDSCPTPALSRLKRHTIAPGDTLESLAQRYNLIPATLMGFNPALRTGKAAPGTQIIVPPFNGIRVDLQPGQTLRSLAKTYKVRPDVLFEVNGCQTAPKTVFIPGVNWTPTEAARPIPAKATKQILAGFPLSLAPSEARILLKYGYGVQAGTEQVAFHSGVDLAAPVGSRVLSMGSGTVAFAGSQGAFGKMVVINHAEGLQTRYAQLSSITVKTGQAVSRGQAIATVGTSGRPSSREPHLHFELRSRSNLGWVAIDPATLLNPTSQRTSAQTEKR